MADTVSGAIRDRLRLRSVVAWCALAAFLFWLFDGTIVRIGTSLASAVIVGLTDVLDDVYGLRSRVRSLGVGLVVLLSGLGLFALSEDPWWLPVAFLAIGVWIVLDAVQTLRHEGATTDDEPRDGREVYHDYVTRRVDETLRERPLTRRELSTALDADDGAIDRGLAALDDRGLLVRRGSELRVRSPPDPGTLARARGLVVTAATRLARPLTVEFETEPSVDDADDRDRYRPTDDGADPESVRDADREPAGRR